MAQRRMFSLKIIDTDLFLDMPVSTQLLYFHLAMRADDDGFIGSPKKIMKLASASSDDINLLIAKNFIIPFQSGIIVIKHWKEHNYIPKDRYIETIYKEEKKQLSLDENKMYTDCIQNVDTGKDRIGKVRLGKVGEGKKFIPPTLEQVEQYCQKRNRGVNPEKWYNHYLANGWKVGKNSMKDWRAAVRTWENDINKYSPKATKRPINLVFMELQCARMPVEEIKRQLLEAGYAEVEIDKTLAIQKVKQ